MAQNAKITIRKMYRLHVHVQYYFSFLIGQIALIPNRTGTPRSIGQASQFTKFYMATLLGALVC